MVRVTTTDDPDAKLVLIVDNNPMGTMRLNQIFTQKGWRIEICEDGDLAVDTYVTQRPHLVLLSLDIPTMDGHTAALEMRESAPDARIAFRFIGTRSGLSKFTALSTCSLEVIVKYLLYLNRHKEHLGSLHGLGFILASNRPDCRLKGRVYPTSSNQQKRNINTCKM